MTDREERVVNAMIEAVRNGDWTLRYVTLALEDDSRYGWMSDEAKQYFYDHVEGV